IPVPSSLHCWWLSHSLSRACPPLGTSSVTVIRSPQIKEREPSGVLCFISQSLGRGLVQRLTVPEVKGEKH
ncbi:hypothetical protein JZ751_011606, partial [Albula glossodonta]